MLQTEQVGNGDGHRMSQRECRTIEEESGGFRCLLIDIPPPQQPAAKRSGVLASSLPKAAWDPLVFTTTSPMVSRGTGGSPVNSVMLLQ